MRVSIRMGIINVVSYNDISVAIFINYNSNFNKNLFECF
jgi:hypothetical protein